MLATKPRLEGSWKAIEPLYSELFDYKKYRPWWKSLSNFDRIDQIRR